jgi:hypothetical protein
MGCGGVVVRVEGVRGGVYGRGDNTGKSGRGRAEPCLDPLQHLSDGGGVRGPTQRGISQGGDPTGLELGTSWIDVALSRCQTMG